MFSSHTIITGGTFTQQQHFDNGRVYGAKTGFELLRDATSPAAFHNSAERFDPPKCHPKTRKALLWKILLWIFGLDPETREALIMWLHGAAGAGKSAIAQTIAELCYSEAGKTIAATFFFSRSDPTRNHERSLISTIAYQLCLNFPEVREPIVLAVEHDPFIFTRSLNAQITSLILKPIESLSASGVFTTTQARRVIIIDGLDECKNSQAQVQIIDVFGQDPATQITIHYILKTLALDNCCDLDADIRLFLRDKFAEIRNSHPFKVHIPASWPSEEVENRLVEKSSGQFIYASTVITFVESIRHRPHVSLDILLGLRPNPAQRDVPFGELDALYTHILCSAVDTEMALKILGLIILTPNATNLSLNFICDFFTLEDGELQELFCDLTSLISIYTCDEYPDILRHGNQYFELLHASLSDFLLDQSRSKGLFLDPPTKRTEYAHICFQHLKAARSIYQIPYYYESNTYLDCLFESLEGAWYTEETRNDLREFAVFELSPCRKQDGKGYDKSFLTSFLPDLLSCIEHQKVPERELHTLILELIDQILAQEIQTYYSDERLTFLAAMTGNTNFSKRFPLFPETKEAKELFQLDDALLDLDNSSLHLIWVEFEDHTWPYSTLIHGFLSDPLRSGKLALNGGRYAIAALCCMKYLCNYPSKESQIYSKRERKMRVNMPWKWHKLVICHGTAHMKTKKLKRMTAQTTQVKAKIAEAKDEERDPDARLNHMMSLFSTFTDFSLPKHSALQPFIWGFEALPFLLDRSDKSEQLVAFASRRGFPKVALGLPRQTKRAKQAIANYLNRVSKEM